MAYQQHVFIPLIWSQWSPNLEVKMRMMIGNENDGDDDDGDEDICGSNDDD